VRREHPRAAVLDSAEELWRRANELDVAVVAAPNRFHVPLASAALDAGLAVVVDKPCAPTAEEGQRLIAHARHRNLPLTVFHNRRWDADLLTVERLIGDGALGAVHRFESRFELWRPQPRSGWRELSAREEAGGVLYDLGSHLIDQALHLFGPVRSIYCELDVRRPGSQVDDDAFLALTHVSGMRSHLWMSRAAALPGPRMRVLGSRAAYVKEGLDGQEPALASGARPDAPDWGTEPERLWGHLGTEGTFHRVRTEPGAYPRFYSGLVAALRDGAPVPVDPHDAIEGLRIIEEAKRTAGRSLAPAGER